MAQPRVTALINTYNYGRFVGEAIESVLAQDVPPGEMEVLVVDDGSTDDTAAQVARFGERVRYVRKENGGQASALNVGFAEARGEIIATLDGDDLWLPGKVRRVVEAFEKDPKVGMVYHPFLIWNAERNTCKKDTEFCGVSGNVAERLEKLLRFGGPSTSGISVRREAVGKILPVPHGLRILADAYLGYLMVFVAPVTALAEFLTKYRVHGDNLYYFAAADPERLRQRWSCVELAAREMEAWLAGHDYDVRRPEIAAYLRRARLTAETLRMQAEGATRWELFAHLQEHLSLYGPIWSWRYRALRRVQALLVLMAGERAYHATANAYRRSGALLRMREWLFPVARS